MEWNVDNILSGLHLEYSSNQTEEDEKSQIYAVKAVAPIDKATEEEIAFCSLEGQKAILAISKSRAGIILCKKSMEGLLIPYSSRKQLQKKQRLIFMENPRLAIMHIIKTMYKGQKKGPIGISPRAVISKEAKLGKNCYVGDFSIIGDNCEIGDNTIIQDRVNILENSKIGKNCIIQPGVVVCADGFAYERHSDSLELERFPHIGGVRIGNNVEISSNCSIVRGSLSDTIIDDGTKLDALVHVAHNVQIGKNSALTAGTIIGGSTIIGDTCWLGLNCTLKHKIKIGNKVIVGSGASVINDIHDEDIVAGVPAKSIKGKVRSNQLFLMGGHRQEQPLRQVDDEINKSIKGQFKMVSYLLSAVVLTVPLLGT
jgi:UDP-3-O-[3-hydroxymyristoyl] glucosamine N-acyltransferase